MISVWSILKICLVKSLIISGEHMYKMVQMKKARMTIQSRFQNGIKVISHDSENLWLFRKGLWENAKNMSFHRWINRTEQFFFTKYIVRYTSIYKNNVVHGDTNYYYQDITKKIYTV